MLPLHDPRHNPLSTRSPQKQKSQTLPKNPQIVGFDTKKSKKFRFEGDLTADAVAAFAASVLDGTATPVLKSAPPPESPLDGDVAVVVGKTFDAIVKDPARDVLLEVYAPWRVARPRRLPAFLPACMAAPLLQSRSLCSAACVRPAPAAPVRCSLTPPPPHTHNNPGPRSL